jgi:hypothetical protein
MLLEWSAAAQPAAEEVEERSHDKVSLVFSDFNLEKTWELLRNLQLEDCRKAIRPFGFLVNSSVRAIVTGKPKISRARDSQFLHVKVES